MVPTVLTDTQRTDLSDNKKLNRKNGTNRLTDAQREFLRAIFKHYPIKTSRELQKLIGIEKIKEICAKCNINIEQRGPKNMLKTLELKFRRLEEYV